MKGEISSHKTIDVVFRWQEGPGDVHDRAVLVIDTLRATTTMCAMLASGAEAIFPVADLDTAYRMKEERPDLVLGGERNNLPPTGFEGGNSPFDYPPERVSGRSVVFTTTNGTSAIEKARGVRWLGLAGLVNARAAIRAMMAVGASGLIFCAGTQGSYALEDVLAAGAIVAGWPEDSWTDGARIAYLTYAHYEGRLLEGIQASLHGQNLKKLGLAHDLGYAASLDRVGLVPVLSPDGWLRSETP